MFGAPGWMEMLIVGIIALLLFGKRMPEVARSLGKGIVEFKKGLHGIEDDANQAAYTAATPSQRPIPRDEVEQVTAPRFEPPAAAPVASDEHKSQS